MQPVEGRDGAMMKPGATWRNWILILVMIAWIYLASSLLKSAASPAVKYTVLGVIGITEILIGLSIAVEQVFPFAVGLLFLGTLPTNLQLFHVSSFTFPSDRSEIAVVPAAIVALLLSPWIGRVIHRLSFVGRFELLDREEEPPCRCDPRDEDVEILIRLDHLGVDLLRKPRCIVTIRHRSKFACSTPTSVNASGCRGQHAGLHDHKLPFWIK